MKKFNLGLLFFVSVSTAFADGHCAKSVTLSDIHIEAIGSVFGAAYKKTQKMVATELNAISGETLPLTREEGKAGQAGSVCEYTTTSDTNRSITVRFTFINDSQAQAIVESDLPADVKDGWGDLMKGASLENYVSAEDILAGREIDLNSFQPYSRYENATETNGQNSISLQPPALSGSISFGN